MLLKQIFRGVLLLLIPAQLFGQGQSEKAVLDLSALDFDRQEIVLLKGTAEFYWDQLLSPEDLQAPDSAKEYEYTGFPSLWTDSGYPAYGAATYRINVVLPGEDQDLTMEIPDVYTSYRLYINGVLFAQNGKPALTKERYTPEWKHIQKPLQLLPASALKDTLDIVLQVANYDHSKGGTSQELILGTSEAMKLQKNKELAYAWILAGVLLMTSLFFFGLFAFSSTDRSILYFALFCLFYTYRVVGFGAYPLHDLMPDLPWILTARLEYITFFMSVYFFGLFTRELYPEEAYKPLMDILGFICISVTVIALFFPAGIFTLLINPFLVITSIYIFYAFYIYLQGVINKRPGSLFALASTGVGFLIFLYQIADYYNYLEALLIVYFIGYVLFIFLQSLILTYRFTKALEDARSKAESASTAKSEFLSTMSHEIRTPLNAVIGFSGLLDDERLSNEQVEYLRSIRLSGENLLGIVNNILDYSKIESGRLDIDYSMVDPKQMIKAVFELVSPTIKGKPIELVSQVDDQLPALIYTDKTRLQQVLINLVNNAIKFTEEGFVKVSAGLNNREEYPGNICFRIEDTGIGISVEDRKKLFKRFSQVDTGKTRKYGGTGLGLVISKEIVEALGGRIQVESKAGSGTTFIFTINSDPAAAAGPELDMRKDISGLELKSLELIENKGGDFQNLRVLVAEDNIFNQKVTLKILEKLGITAELAVDGREAVDKAMNASYNLILMDMEMPVLDGVEATKQIRNNERSMSRKSTIIALTANAMVDDRERCFEAGMNDYLSKPMTIDSTYKTLRKWFVKS